MKYRNYLLFMIFNIFALWLAPVAVNIVTIGTYILNTDVIDISVILVSLTIFNLLQFPVRSMPEAIASIIELIISLRRIEVNNNN